MFKNCKTRKQIMDALFSMVDPAYYMGHTIAGMLEICNSDDESDIISEALVAWNKLAC